MSGTKAEPGHEGLGYLADRVHENIDTLSTVLNGTFGMGAEALAMAKEVTITSEERIADVADSLTKAVDRLQSLRERLQSLMRGLE